MPDTLLRSRYKAETKIKTPTFTASFKITLPKEDGKKEEFSLTFLKNKYECIY